MDRVVRRRRLTTGRISLIGIAGILAAAGFFLYPSLNRWASAERSVEIGRLRLGQAVRGDLLRDVSVQGRIVAADRPTLISPAQGVVTLLVKPGDVVRKRDVMARIESPEVRNRLEQERSVLSSMRSDLERLKISSEQKQLQNRQQVTLLELKVQASEKAMERARKLREEGLASSIDFEKARDDLEIARLELAHARENIRLAKENAGFEIRTRELELERQELVVEDVSRKVEELAVLSPVDGLVARVDVKDKDAVQANQSLFSVVDLSKFEVEVLVPENYTNEIAPGTPVAILYEGREYAGKVKSISPEVEASQFKGVVAFSDQPPSGLKQNQRVDTRLLLDSRRNVVKVPRGPFLETLGGRQVYVVEEGMARLRAITAGAVSVTEVEISSGLAEGEKIVLSDMTRYDGAKLILLRK
ncbi:MAG: efflux RND transporter periplasmic adaptor subunit [Acidobacteria bacterium]|nr:efflux RND transporter periplasmic adaptor subunit [Acidobacteriota bacterium]